MNEQETTDCKGCEAQGFKTELTEEGFCGPCSCEVAEGLRDADGDRIPAKYLIQVTRDQQVTVAAIEDGDDMESSRHPDHQGWEIGEGECTCEDTDECIAYDLLRCDRVPAHEVAEYACRIVEDKTASYRFALVAELQEEVAGGDDSWWSLSGYGQQTSYLWGSEDDAQEVCDHRNGDREINLLGIERVGLGARGDDDVPMWDALPEQDDTCNAADELAAIEEMEACNG